MAFAFANALTSKHLVSLNSLLCLKYKSCSLIYVDICFYHTLFIYFCSYCEENHGENFGGHVKTGFYYVLLRNPR